MIAFVWMLQKGERMNTQVANHHVVNVVRTITMWSEIDERSNNLQLHEQRDANGWPSSWEAARILDTHATRACKGQISPVHEVRAPAPAPPPPTAATLKTNPG